MRILTARLIYELMSWPPESPRLPLTEHALKCAFDLKMYNQSAWARLPVRNEFPVSQDELRFVAENPAVGSVNWKSKERRQQQKVRSEVDSPPDHPPSNAVLAMAKLINVRPVHLHTALNSTSTMRLRECEEEGYRAICQEFHIIQRAVSTVTEEIRLAAVFACQAAGGSVESTLMGLLCVLEGHSSMSLRCEKKEMHADVHRAYTPPFLPGMEMGNVAVNKAIKGMSILPYDPSSTTILSATILLTTLSLSFTSS